MSEVTMPTVRKIPLSPSMKRFTQGVAAGSSVNEAHEGQPFATHEAQVAFYWFYVGALAASKYKITEQEDFSNFILGATTRAPQRPDEDER